MLYSALLFSEHRNTLPKYLRDDRAFLGREIQLPSLRQMCHTATLAVPQGALRQPHSAEYPEGERRFLPKTFIIHVFDSAERASPAKKPYRIIAHGAECGIRQPGDTRNGHLPNRPHWPQKGT